MKRVVGLMALLILVFTVTPATADFYVIAGGGAVGTKITSLPYTINTPGFYFLGGNLTSSGNGITITGSNVTLDLMGFSLVGSNTGWGFGLGGDGGQPDNVEIRNGTIRNFASGVNGQITPSIPSNDSRMINVRINHCSTYGARFDGTSHLVKDCTFTTNGGAGLTMSSGTISGCVAKGNGTGITLQGAGSVIGNFANNNALFNFALGAVDTKTEIMVDRNSASGPTPNYLIHNGSTGIVGLSSGTTTNAGAP